MSIQVNKVLIVDDMHPCIFDFFTSSAFEVEYKTDLTFSELKTFLSTAHILILRSKFQVNEELLNAAPQLKIVARVGSGVDNILVEECNHRSIRVLNAPEGNSKAVAEHTLGLILSLLNKIAWADAQIRLSHWPRKQSRGLELGGKTVGIIGYGHTGSAFGHLLQNFGCTCLAYDRKGDFNTDPWVRAVSLEELLDTSDVISLHIPLDEKNYRWVNQTFIEKVSKPFFLINTSRGEIIDPQAVKLAMEHGKIKGMALDVLPNENIDSLTSEENFWFKWLISQENVVLTPHVAGWSDESYERLSMIIGQKICDVVLNQYN